MTWGAAAQSVKLARRVYKEELDRLFEELAGKFAGGSVPLPDNWGGYRIDPVMIEFWQGRPSRLHDRIRFTRIERGNWRRERLSP